MRILVIAILFFMGLSGCMVKPMVITPYVPRKLVPLNTIRATPSDSVLEIKPSLVLDFDASIGGNNSGDNHGGGLLGGIGLTVPLGRIFFIKNEFTFLNIGLSTAVGIREPNNFAIAVYNRIVKNGLEDSGFCYRNNFFPGAVVTKSLSYRPRIYYGTFVERNGLGSLGGGLLWGGGGSWDIGDPVLDLGAIFGIYPFEMRLYTHNLTPRGIGWHINYILEY